MHVLTHLFRSRIARRMCLIVLVLARSLRIVGARLPSEWVARLNPVSVEKLVRMRGLEPPLPCEN